MTDLSTSVDRLTKLVERLYRTIDDRDAQIGQMAAMAMKPPHFGTAEAIKILRLAQDGGKIHAIKAMRDLSGCDLKTAKELVESNFQFGPVRKAE